VHESNVELRPRIALLGKGRQPSKRGGVLAPLGRGDGIVKLGGRCRTNQAESQDEECESSVDHAHPPVMGLHDGAARRHDQDGAPVFAYELAGPNQLGAARQIAVFAHTISWPARRAD
jgi:hypothetical protein